MQWHHIMVLINIPWYLMILNIFSYISFLSVNILLWKCLFKSFAHFIVVQLLSPVWLFAVPWTTARQASSSFTLRVCLNSCPLSRWCHPTISSSVSHLSSCPQYFPASESFPISWFFSSGGLSISVSVR